MKRIKHFVLVSLGVSFKTFHSNIFSVILTPGPGKEGAGTGVWGGNAGVVSKIIMYLTQHTTPT